MIACHRSHEQARLEMPGQPIRNKVRMTFDVEPKRDPKVLDSILMETIGDNELVIEWLNGERHRGSFAHHLAMVTDTGDAIPWA